MASSSGRPASSPVWATRPGRIRSATEKPVPEAMRPSPANDSKMMRERLFQFEIR